MTKQQFISQLEKAYASYLADIVLGKAFASIVLRGGKNDPVTTIELHEQMKFFQQSEKTETKSGWTIEWEEWNSKKFGRQQWPKSISVQEESDLLFLLKKEKETEVFKSAVQMLTEWKPELPQWISQNVRDILPLKEVWPSLKKVVDYLLVNDVKEFYLRSIPVPVHTKFVEDHGRVIVSLLKYLKPEKFSSQISDLESLLDLRRKSFLFTARWLDRDCAKTFTNNMVVLGITPEDLQVVNWKIDKVILTENETSLYQLPELKNTLALCSNGKTVSLLKNIPLLANTRLFYWGDMDDEGFLMLNHLRQFYPLAQSVMMDQPTLDLHEAEITIQPVKYKNIDMPGLKPSEYAAYKMLAERNGRLEQEQLQHLYISKCVTD
ncbi:Wadjet anti-phage system protein JetD domain-containing protein [Pinibacter aurantiacus]|uniref:DUF3322 and DUF2220 domain-containing protein n=1 Tax=Pinibacter aurantiacus TaxID=2851599 RepID=A0A9E2S5D9_9BACT|nr:Wadjet anti-phage system protein JetD domain-containing protein [Pinibacter aurantiacus]MBV4356256.1 hypothetical protein [Pinibacter aurantiacus]